MLETIDKVCVAQLFHEAEYLKNLVHNEVHVVNMYKYLMNFVWARRRQVDLTGKQMVKMTFEEKKREERF